MEASAAARRYYYSASEARHRTVGGKMFRAREARGTFDGSDTSSRQRERCRARERQRDVSVQRAEKAARARRCRWPALPHAEAAANAMARERTAEFSCRNAGHSARREQVSVNAAAIPPPER